MYESAQASRRRGGRRATVPKAQHIEGLEEAQKHSAQDSDWMAHSGTPSSLSSPSIWSCSWRHCVCARLLKLFARRSGNFSPCATGAVTSSDWLCFLQAKLSDTTCPSSRRSTDCCFCLKMWQEFLTMNFSLFLI